MSDNMTMETADIPVGPEMTEVVVYNIETVENVLKIIDTQTPVIGIETMRKLVEVFDILKHEGSVQQAAVNREGDSSEFVNPEFTPDFGPTFTGEGDVMYNAEDEAEETTGESTTVDVGADELREIE